MRAFFFSTRTLTIGAWSGVALTLFFTLFYPLGFDGSYYAVCGAMARAGGLPFRDFLDIKSPLVHWENTVAQFFISDKAYAFRAIDAVLQCGICCIVWNASRRYFGVNVAALAIVSYALMYAGLLWLNMPEPEIYGGGLFLASALLFLRAEQEEKKKFIFAFYSGALVGLTFWWKYTLLLTGGGLLLLCFDWNQRRVQWKLLNGIILGASIVIGAFFVFIFSFGLWHYWYESVKFASGYGFAREFFSGEFREVALAGAINYMVHRLSVPFAIVLLSFGWWKKCLSEEGRRAAIVFLVMYLAAVATVVFEKRFYSYHFSRTFALAALLGSAGFVELYRTLAKKNIRKVFLIAGAVAFLSFSPLRHARGVWKYAWWRAMLTYEQFLDQCNTQDEVYDFPEQYRVARRVHGESVFVWGWAPGVYVFNHSLPQNRFIISQFFSTPWTPSEWNDELMRSLLGHSPAYIVVQTNDWHFFMTRERVATSLQRIATVPGFAELMNRYHVDTTMNHFILFRHKEL